MSGACCLIKADLSRVSVRTEQGVEQWAASDLSPGDAPTAGILAARARTSADWIASLPGVRKKLGAVCLDVEDIRCRWVRATGTAAPILSAATRGLDQDWEQAVLPERVEPVLKDDTTKQTGGGVGGGGYAVLTVADALPRIFLDELDRRGVRANEVISLWHAMARAWDDAKDGRLVCTLLGTQDGRLLWSWSRRGRLLAGGSAPMASDAKPGEAGSKPDESAGESPETRTARRVSLDWLTWSVQLGLSPDLVIAVGALASRAAGALGEQWEGVALSTIEAPEPLSQTMARLVRAPAGDAEDPRSALVMLGSRPTRATRKAYRMGAVALIALAAAGVGVGVRLSSAASSTRDAAQGIKDEARQRVVSRMPAAESQPSIDLFLQQRMAQLQQGAKFRPPAGPPPMYEELERLLGVIDSLEGVILQSIVFTPSGSTSEFTVEVPDTRTGEELKKSLRDLPMAVSWTEQRVIGARGDAAKTIVFKGAFQ